MGPKEAVVVFHNVSDYDWPEELSYSIRMKIPFKTYETSSDLFAPDPVFVSHKLYGKVYVPFMRLQWAIDSSFIQMMTGTEVSQTIRLQELPYLTYAGRPHSYLFKSDILFSAAGIAVMPAFFTAMLRKIIQKATGIQDLMKVMGVTTFSLVISQFLNALLPGLIYSVGATVLMKVEPEPVLPKSNGVLIFLAIFLHYIFTVGAAMTVSSLARNAPPTALTATGTYILLALPAYIFHGMDISKLMVYSLALLPNMPLSWIFKETCKLEGLGPGLTYTTMLGSHTATAGPAIAAYVILILHIILCLFLIWYLDQVFTDIFGSWLPWNFLFKKKYWFTKCGWFEKSIIAKDETVQTSKPKNLDPQYFETPPKHLDVGIQFINITKEYPMDVRALDNVSLDVYKGELTILLGHNGAGKSTLMSVVTGVTSPTSGKVLVNGMSILSERELARQHIGFCPQQHIFFQHVTVIEHVMFFTLLNRGTFKEARISSYRLLDKLHLKSEANKYPSVLSGGMRRRVQLACALAGQANILLLDEPTSGLDLETRRALWDLLLFLRGPSVTILMSTHFMEEADALGDRVVALQGGELRCHATPMYLKRAMGTDYRLTFTTIGLPNEAAITRAIKTVIPEATVRNAGFNSISYNLPYERKKAFPSLFAKLELQKSELKIDTIGIGNHTIEEVFLKLCTDDTSPITIDELQGREAPMYKKLTGVRLYFRQMLALMKRYLRFLWSHKITQIGLGIVRVIIIILVITVITNDAKTETPRHKTRLSMNLDMYKPSNDLNILYKLNGSDSELRPLSDQYPRVNFIKASDVPEEVLRVGQRDKMEFSKYVAGIELNDTDAKVLFTTTVRHAAPAALNLMSNLLATRLMPWADGRTITTYNHPIVIAYVPDALAEVKQPKSINNIKIWMSSTALMLLSGIIFMIQLPCKEAVGTRHIHMMAGCSPELHWGTTLLSAAIQVLLTYVVTLGIACATLDFDDTFSDKEFILAASVVVLLGTLAMLAISYKIAFHFDQSIAVGIIGLMQIFFVLIFPLMSGFMPSAEKFKPFALMLVPPYTFNEGLMSCAMTAFLNTLCKRNRDKCPALALPVQHFDAEKCCGLKTNPWCYFCFQEPSPGKKIWYMIAQIVIYMTFVILTERRVFSQLWEKITNHSYKEPTHRYNDPAVNAERAYVEKAIRLPPKHIPDLMLVSNVHKNYHDCCNSYNAVKGVSFSVKKGECFGLLGVNGAGKSSLFQMLTAIRCPTKGRIIVNGRELTIPFATEYLYSLGYCPQFWALDDFLTGRQNIDLLLTLNGLNARDAKTETLSWMKLIGLEKYMDQVVSNYSGGCQRRMATACALCTGAPVTLMDEPTSGVDVAARRRIWFVLKRGIRHQHSIIITSHSLDEMEALCHRIAIMAAGEICALGSPASLRAAHASGHTINIKIKYDPAVDVIGVNNPKVRLLKAAIEKKFKCTLTDEHPIILQYHIHEMMHYSTLFLEMEQLSASFSDLLEDYSVSESTLEEVFLSLVKPLPEKPAKKDVAAGPS
ncbi:hypothetical protein ABMA27_005834 [Loxostege sticticalis]|uniref:ABC transporter domain-containing protein n=1 Tax=Loxostege sticticalis TaxID=481309 RepID=A0ABR3HGM5_LOXSC